MTDTPTGYRKLIGGVSEVELLNTIADAYGWRMGTVDNSEDGVFATIVYLPPQGGDWGEQPFEVRFSLSDTGTVQRVVDAFDHERRTHITGLYPMNQVVASLVVGGVRTATEPKSQISDVDDTLGAITYRDALTISDQHVRDLVFAGTRNGLTSAELAELAPHLQAGSTVVDMSDDVWEINEADVWTCRQYPTIMRAGAPDASVEPFTWRYTQSHLVTPDGDDLA